MDLKSFIVYASLAIGSPSVAQDTQIVNVIDTTQEGAGKILGFVDFIRNGQGYTTKYFMGGLPEEVEKECTDYPEDVICGETISDNLSPYNFDIGTGTTIGYQTWEEGSI